MHKPVTLRPLTYGYVTPPLFTSRRRIGGSRPADSWCQKSSLSERSNPFDMWDEMLANAAAGRFPKGTDIFLHKFHGLFYVAPNQDAFMLRLRLPGGIVSALRQRDCLRSLSASGASISM